MLFEDVQHKVNVHLMSFIVLLFCFSRLVSGMDGNVIHIYGEPSLSHLFLKDGVHHHLECGRGVSEAEKHHCGFKEPFWSEEGGLPFISWLNSNIVVSLTDVKLRKKSAATEAVNGLCD
jgi:hypothetical protein